MHSITFTSDKTVSSAECSASKTGAMQPIIMAGFHCAIILVRKFSTTQPGDQTGTVQHSQDLRKIVLARRANADSTQVVRQGGLSRGFEQHAASLRNGLRMQAQTRPARATQLGRFCVSPNSILDAQ